MSRRFLLVTVVCAAFLAVVPVSARAQTSPASPLWDEEKNPEGRWRVFSYDELVARDKASLDIFWLKDHSLEHSSDLPDPHVLAEEIAEDLRSALEQIESVLADLQARASTVNAGGL